jgi:hypothetical protein
MKAITENTAVSIGLLMAAIGFSAYLGSKSFQADANAKEITELKQRVSSLEEIKSDIAVIKTRIEAIDRKIPNQ